MSIVNTGAITVALRRYLDAQKVSGAPKPPKGTQHPKMTIVPAGGKPFTVPYAPSSVSYDGVVPVWTQTERGGRTPLLLEGGQPLRTITFDLVLGWFDPNASIESVVGDLYAVAKSGERLKVNLDRRTNSFTWRMTGFSMTVVGRKHGTNEATRATASITLTQVSDPVVAVGPVSGGAKSKPPAKKPKTYTFRKGDSLQSIAKKYYGTTKAWRKIADANKIKKPKNLKVGRKLRLP